VQPVTLCGKLLGRMRVTVDDRATVAAWPRPGSRRLVALLLLADQHVLPREVVAATLFDHLEARSAARAVSKALSQARRVLDAGRSPPSLLGSDRASIWIAEHARVQVDLVGHLEALTAATRSEGSAGDERILRGALDGAAPVLVDDRYEPWAHEVVTEVERARRDARLALARMTGTPADWRTVADTDPANEEACAALVTHYLQAGRRQEAARTVARSAEALAELGVAIDPRLLAALAPPAATDPLGANAPAARVSAATEDGRGRPGLRPSGTRAEAERVRCTACGR
jgi:DNA-binding SARP family transcriptional activator